MHNINIIAFQTVCACEDIVFMLNTASSEMNIRLLLSEYLRKNKVILGLDRYYVSLNNNGTFPTVTIEFCFRTYPDNLEISFSHRPNGYNSSLKNQCLVVSIPLHYNVDGFIYCDNYNNYLYVDQFTYIAPILYSEREVTVHELTGGYISGLNEHRVNLLHSFIERMRYGASEKLRTLNIDETDLDDAFSEDSELVKEYIDKYDITCVVTSQQDIFDCINKYSSCPVVVYSQDDLPPIITLEKWVRRAITFIKKEYDFTQDSKGIYCSVHSLMRNFDISKRTISNACKNEFDDKELSELSKYLPFVTR